MQEDANQRIHGRDRYIAFCFVLGFFFPPFAGGAHNTVCHWPTRGDATHVPTAAPQQLGDSRHPGRL